VYESDVPGVGRKFELELGGDASVVVGVHHDGRCELFRRDGPDADAEKVLDLKSEQANRLGSILEGAYFESVDANSLSVPLGEAIIE
jgi:TrkA domain protein